MGRHLCCWHLRIGRRHGLGRGADGSFPCALPWSRISRDAGGRLPFHGAQPGVVAFACDHFLPEIHRPGHDYPHCLSRHVAVVYRDTGQSLVHSFAWFRPGSGCVAAGLRCSHGDL